MKLVLQGIAVLHVRRDQFVVSNQCGLDDANCYL